MDAQRLPAEASDPWHGFSCCFPLLCKDERTPLVRGVKPRLGREPGGGHRLEAMATRYQVLRQRHGAGEEDLVTFGPRKPAVFVVESPVQLLPPFPGRVHDQGK